LLAYLTREGVGIDFGRHAEVVLDQQEAIHKRYPRLAMVRSLVNAIVEHAACSDAAAPRHAIPGELLHERRPGSRQSNRHSSCTRAACWLTTKILRTLVRCIWSTPTPGRI
jgi:hypothetical protein